MKISKRIKSGLLATIMLVVLIIPLFPVVSYAGVSNIQWDYFHARQGCPTKSGTYDLTYLPYVGTKAANRYDTAYTHEETRRLNSSGRNLKAASGHSSTEENVVSDSYYLDSDYSFGIGHTSTNTATVNQGTGNVYADGYSAGMNGNTDPNYPVISGQNATWYYKLKQPGLSITYKRYGYYDGQSVDVKMTVVGWERNWMSTYDNQGVWIRFNNKKPGYSITGGSCVAICIDFYNSSTGIRMTNIKGYVNFTDIDGGQGIHLISGYDKIYTTHGTGDSLYITKMQPVTLSYNLGTYISSRKSAYTPLIYDGGYLASNGNYTFNQTSDEVDAPNWCMTTFSGTLVFVGVHDTRYSSSDTTAYPGTTVNRKISPGGNLTGTNNTKLITSLPDVSHVITDTSSYVENKTDTISKTLSNRTQQFEYVIDYNIPAEFTSLHTYNPSLGMYANSYYTYDLVNKLPPGIEVVSMKLKRLPNDGSYDSKDYLSSSGLQFTKSQTGSVSSGLTLTLKSPTTQLGSVNATATNPTFFDCVMRWYIVVKISDSTTLSTGTTTFKNTASIKINTDNNSQYVSSSLYKTITGNDTTAKITISSANSPSVSKYFDSSKTQSTHAPHGDSTVTYYGDIYVGSLEAPTSISITDTLPDGVTYNSITQLIVENTSINSSTYITNTSSGKNINISLKSNALTNIMGRTIRYAIKCNLTDPRYKSPRTAVSNATYPNTLKAVINGTTYSSNTATMYRSAVALPTKITDSNNVLTNKESTATFIVSHYLASKTSNYYYGSYAIKDSIDPRLTVKSYKIESNGEDCSSWFNIQENYNTITAQARSYRLETPDFYGRTFDLIIEVGINPDYDFSGQTDGNAISIPNTGQVVVDDETFNSTPAYVYYKPAATTITKQVYDEVCGTYSDVGILNDSNHPNSDTIKYTGEITISPTTNPNSIILTDESLDDNLVFENIEFEWMGNDITDYFYPNYYDDNHTLDVFINDIGDAFGTGQGFFESLGNGSTLKYTITCRYTGTYNEWKLIPNKIHLSVQGDKNEELDSNLATLVVRGIPELTKSISQPSVATKDQQVKYFIEFNIDDLISEIEDYTWEFYPEFYDSPEYTDGSQRYYIDPYQIGYEEFTVMDTLDKAFDYVDTSQMRVLRTYSSDSRPYDEWSDVTYNFDCDYEYDETIYAMAYDTYEDFYGYKYCVEIPVNISKDADLTDYIDDDGNAVIKNQAYVSVDYNEYEPCEPVTLTYTPAENSIDKYILNGSSKVTNATLNGNTVTYTGSMTITDKYPVETIQFTDNLQTGLTYKNLTVKLDETDITSQIDNNSNSRQVGFSITPASSYNPSNCMGKTLTYTIECTYDGSNVQKINNTANLQTQSSDGTHEDTITSNNTTLTRNITSSITKYINDHDTSYSLHKNSEDITYTGSFTIGTDLSSSLVLQDDLASGLTYKSLKIYSPEFLGPNLPFTHSTDVLSDDYDVTSIAGTNSSSGKTVKYTFNSSNFDKLKGLTLSYELVVTASKSYNGSATSNEKIPNTMQLKVNGTTFNSNTPNLYRAGVAKPTKSVNKSSVANKTDDVVYTISHEVSSRTSEYYYNTYVISDQLDSVLKYKSSKIVNESNTDVSSSFTVSQSGNLITATAKSPTSSSFYGHTYKLQITAGIADNNTDLSSHTSSSGLVTIPNKAKVVVDGNTFETSTVNYTYQPKSSSITKYINDNDTSYSLHKNSENITYTGSFTIGADLSSSLVLQDNLASGLTYKSLIIYSPDWIGSGHPDTSTAAYYDVTSNVGTNSSSRKTVKFTFDPDVFDDLKEATLNYELVVTASKTYDGSATTDEIIPNMIQLIVDGKTINSNTPNLYRAGVAKPIKSVNKSSVTNKTDEVVYTISHEVSSRTSEYYYKTYAIEDQLDPVFSEYSAVSTKIINESGTDVSSQFDISKTINSISHIITVTATAKSPTSSSFYGHTYKLQITAHMPNNADLSSYANGSGLATIPNKARVTVDGNAFETSTVNYTYQTKSDNINKYILNSKGQKVETDTLTDTSKDTVITYTGDVKIQDKDAITSIIITDKLDSNLTIKNTPSFKIGSKDITSYGTLTTNNNTITFTPSSDKLSELAGATITYTITCGIAENSLGKTLTIPNTIKLSVNGKETTSNETSVITSAPSVGNLAISKTVKNGTSNKAFAFTLTLNGTYQGTDGKSHNANEFTGQRGEITFTNGTANFNLSHGQKLTAKDIPDGLTYTITESNDGFDTYVTDKSGKTTQGNKVTGTITANETAEANFTNMPSPVLPITGGPGITGLITLSIILGLIGSLIAVFCIIKRKQLKVNSK